MDAIGSYQQACHKHGAPLWISSVLEVASGMKDDKLRRRKAYRLVCKQLRKAGVGSNCTSFPTYVYPENLKALIRSVFPDGVCDYPDPINERAVKVTTEELFLVESIKS